jgi:hypothetical protein
MIEAMQSIAHSMSSTQDELIGLLLDHMIVFLSELVY